MDDTSRQSVEAARTIEPLLHSGEVVHAMTTATEGVIAVTDRRLLVAAGARVALDLTFDGLRRIEFDVERNRPATLVIVPDHPRTDPQVLSIPPGQYASAAHVLAEIAHRLARSSKGMS